MANNKRAGRYKWRDLTMQLLALPSKERHDIIMEVFPDVKDLVAFEKAIHGAMYHHIHSQAKEMKRVTGIRATGAM